MLPGVEVLCNNCDKGNLVEREYCSHVSRVAGSLRLGLGSVLPGKCAGGLRDRRRAGRIAAKGRNAIYDDESITPLAGTNLAHAEIVALSQLKRGEHETGEYTLYTTLEPCPMCFGAIVMTGIRKVRYAARDGLAGSAVLTGATPYIASKQISVALEGSSLEVFQIALTTAFELRRQHPRQEVILSCLRADCPEGVALGTRLFQRAFFHSL